MLSTLIVTKPLDGGSMISPNWPVDLSKQWERHLKDVWTRPEVLST